VEQQTIGEFKAAGGAVQRRSAGFAAAIALHLLIAWALINAISFRFVEPKEEVREPQVVALVSRPPPPPPEVEALGAANVVLPLPRFRPRIPKSVPGREQRRFGDPALAIWKYLCNRDMALSEATRRACPTFSLGDANLGMRDPLNSGDDIGALLGPDTATMSLQEAGRKKGWFKPKSPWPKDGARAQGDDLGLPGHDPFAILPGR